MQQFANEKTHIIALGKGEDLHTTLQDLALNAGWASAWVQGLGGAALVTLGFFDPIKKQYQWKTVTGQHEILSLQGNLAWVEGKPLWHIHGSFSGADYRVIGGHVKDLLVGLTCELAITPLETPVTRVFDDDTGLKLLHGRIDTIVA